MPDNSCDGDIKFEGTLVGEVTRYFDKIMVAAIKCCSELSVGDQIKIFNKQGDILVDMTVESMQMEHNEVLHAKSGDEVGLKVNGKVKPGDLIYRYQ